MHNAYITHVGQFLPGDPICNDDMEAYLGSIGDRPSKVRRRILQSNGIQQRHYAIDHQQNTLFSNSQMAAAAVRDALHRADLPPEAIDLLSCATTWPDLLVPGFASMVHGELPEFSPIEATTHQGVCCAGVAALSYATSQVQLGRKQRAIAVASEFASRLFKHTKFEAEAAIQAGQSLSFDTEFLRWMLSDGAGAVLLQSHPSRTGLSLRVDWIELISHANAYPVCMYAGVDDPHTLKSWMDYPSYAEAASDGVINLRQNIRLLDQVIKLGVEGWLRLIAQGRIHPNEIDWLLCHYSSHFFRGQIVDLLTQANCMIPEERWFTNLYTRGNTGCASIYLMLEELFHSGKLQPGQTVFCFVPESGRFTTAYIKLTVVEAVSSPPSVTLPRTKAIDSDLLPTSLSVEPENSSTSAELLQDLMRVWLEFERKIRSVPIVRKLHRNEFTLEDYQALLRNLRPQVVDGARWIARAASNMTDFRLRSLFIGHAQDEHRDFQMLERNYVSVGGRLEHIQNAEKNIGSEALSAFIFHQASKENPIDLVGSMFIIEGLGNRLAGEWADLIGRSLSLQPEQISFLAYHADNDDAHLGKIQSILNAEWMTPDIARRIVKTAQVTARLYVLQLEEIAV
ncbi:MAG: 3-oxoacyl-ACP synthase [Synechococcales cyanobacterium T60_A2020_003]|nr:3-oxoacyl-ACP synthase [Synechococcales cyanobacterium T60_A2020_003]